MSDIADATASSINHSYKTTRYMNFVRQYRDNAWSVSPRFIVGREDTEVTSTYELFILHAKQWIGGAEELWVKDNLQRSIT